MGNRCDLVLRQPRPWPGGPTWCVSFAASRRWSRTSG